MNAPKLYSHQSRAIAHEVAEMVGELLLTGERFNGTRIAEIVFDQIKDFEEAFGEAEMADWAARHGYVKPEPVK